MSRYREPMPALSEPWTLGDLRLHWSAIVGPAIDAVSFARAVRPDGALVVKCDSAWTAELTLLETALLAKLPRLVDGFTLSRIILEESDFWRRELSSAGADEPDADDGEGWKR